MHYSVTFKPRFVPEMIYASAKRLGIHAQVPNAHGLKQEPHRVQIIDQVIGTDSKRRRRDGCVHEISGIGGPDGTLWAEIGIPRGHVFDNKQFLERINIIRNGLVADG